jgi:hypothetical protein
MKANLIFKAHFPPTPARQRGYSLVVVLVFAVVSFLVLGAALDWCMTNSKLTDRSNQYFSTTAAAEAATEKVLASLARDYSSDGEGMVWVNLSNYRNLVPTAAENPEWANFSFSDGAGNANRTYVERLSAAGSYARLASRYRGLYGAASTYRIVSNARMTGAANAVGAGVQQDIQLASIPVFQFAIFYNMDLEINPGPNMTVTGRVHGNANINVQPVNTLTFMSDVTAAGNILHDKHTNDPLVRNVTNSRIVYNAEHDSGADSLTLPIGTNNSSDAVHAIIELPPAGESATSAMGRQRYYNKADLIVVVSNATVTVTSGRGNNFATAIPYAEWQDFISTNVTFFNKREGKTVQTTQINVAKLKQWSENNTSLRPALGNRDVRSLYVADMRTQTAGTESGVKLVDGQNLPSLGLTVATPNPLYVQGHFNVEGSAVGTADTSASKPASLVGDSINILSTAWQDANSALGIGSRSANDTTVNAALLAGIVPSNGTYYSGGVENFPRFLEHWGGRTLTYNGSMVVMFNSKIATAPWGGADVYSPPARNWAFDVNFLDATKLPPGTPEVRAIIRGEWTTVRGGNSASIY